MKRMVFAALAALLVAGVALAGSSAQWNQSTRGVQQPDHVGGVKKPDSSSAIFTFTSDDAVRSSDVDRDRDYVRTWQSSEVISTASLAAAAADSSPVITVGPYRYLKILVKATPIGAAVNTTVRLAFQFRECLNGNTDSTSVFAEYAYGMFPVGSITASTESDTTLAAHIITGSVSQSWSGEYGYKFNMNRSAPASAAAAVPYSYPNGVAISLDSFLGRPARFHKLQIRVRNLNVTGPAVKLDVSMIGFAQ